MAKRRKDQPRANVFARLDDRGHELLDPTPKQIPAGFKRPESLKEQLDRLYLAKRLDELASEQHESFEEADDFEVGDDYEPQSIHEMFFDPFLKREMTAKEVLERSELYAERTATLVPDKPVTPPESSNSGSNPPSDSKGGEAKAPHTGA